MWCFAIIHTEMSTDENRHKQLSLQMYYLSITTMGKKSSAKPKLNNKTAGGKYLPLVSVCTPTFNRRPFIPMMLECFRNQTYPRDRTEWIIVDDGTDKIKDLLDALGADLAKQIRYFPLDAKLSLGAKRNYMHKQAKGSIIVYMDDDDYYPPERVEHAVDTLMANKDALCAGSSEMYIYFKHLSQMYQCGPYGPNHATAGTFAFKSRLLDETRFEDHAALAEEKAFLKNYTVPFVQLDPMKTILVFSHVHNTFDKKKMLEGGDPRYIRASPKTVADFIKSPRESGVRKFFLEDIDALLAAYAPGEPRMKPDVLEQTKKIEEQRMKMMRDMMAQQQQQTGGNPGFITYQPPGQAPVHLSALQTAELMQRQHVELGQMSQKIRELESIIANQQRLLMSNVPAKPAATETVFRQLGESALGEPTLGQSKLKSDPEIRVDL